MVYLALRKGDLRQYSEYFYLSLFLYNIFCHLSHNIGVEKKVWETFYNENLSFQAFQLFMTK